MVGLVTSILFLPDKVPQAKAQALIGLPVIGATEGFMLAGTLDGKNQVKLAGAGAGLAISTIATGVALNWWEPSSGDIALVNSGAFWGAIVVSVVSIVLSLFVRDSTEARD